MSPPPLAVLVAFVGASLLALAPTLSPADSIADFCIGTNGATPKAMANAAASKKSVDDGHYATGKQQAIALQKAADQCIAAHQEPHTWAYLHAWGAMVEAQARLALGDASGTTLMQKAIKEAQAYVDDPQADPGLRKLAKDIVYGGQLELKRYQTAKPGEVIYFTPPPTAPP